MLPPWFSTILLAMERPRPMPSDLVVKNGSNIRLTCCGWMPLPQSVISIVMPLREDMGKGLVDLRIFMDIAHSCLFFVGAGPFPVDDSMELMMRLYNTCLICSLSISQMILFWGKSVFITVPSGAAWRISRTTSLMIPTISDSCIVGLRSLVKSIKLPTRLFRRSDSLMMVLINVCWSAESWDLSWLDISWTPPLTDVSGLRISWAILKLISRKELRNSLCFEMSSSFCFRVMSLMMIINPFSCMSSDLRSEVFISSKVRSSLCDEGILRVNGNWESVLGES